MKEILIEVSNDACEWQIVSAVKTLADYERLKRKLIDDFKFVRLISVIKRSKRHVD